jgi:hypothetical protein
MGQGAASVMGRAVWTCRAGRCATCARRSGGLASSAEPHLRAHWGEEVRSRACLNTRFSATVNTVGPRSSLRGEPLPDESAVCPKCRCLLAECPAHVFLQTQQIAGLVSVLVAFAGGGLRFGRLGYADAG